MLEIKHQHDRFTNKQKPLKWLYYVGMSMYPTLRNLDILSILTVEKEDIHRGDIIVFQRDVSKRMIAHRVISIENDGVKTRGDNMSADDIGLVPFDNITGKVEFLDRGSKCLSFQSGSYGMLKHYTIRFRRRIQFSSRLKSVLRPLMNKLLWLVPARRPLSNSDEVRAYLFNHPQGPVGRLFLGNNLIGCTTNSLNSWNIDPSYRNIVNINMLPASDLIAATGKKSDNNPIESAK